MADVEHVGEVTSYVYSGEVTTVIYSGELVDDEGDIGGDGAATGIPDVFGDDIPDVQDDPIPTVEG